jgi:Arc/MetJ-type ribon-helix-helix transcriptional regulator
MTEQFNVRLDPHTLATIRWLTAELKVSQVDVIRLAVRALARQELASESEKPEKKTARAN